MVDDKLFLVNNKKACFEFEAGLFEVIKTILDDTSLEEHYHPVRSQPAFFS
jgi:hypothetical protein